MIPYGKQSIDKSDIKAVLQILKSDYLTTGPKVEEFEKKFSNWVGAKYAVCVCNGTAALHLACLAADLKRDEELITSALTFAASANCALYCGARPVFVDVNDQGLINENKIEETINKKTKIIIPVHYAGFPCNLKKIKALAKKYHLIVIEDACHALGSRFKKSKIGSCSYSDMTIFSFHPVKQITTGEGGMVTTNDKKFYNRLLMLRSHGITKDKKLFINKNSQNWYYEMQDLGYNFRLTDLQCALGINQLKRLNSFIKKRRYIAKLYNRAFEKNKRIRIIKEADDQFNSYHLYPIRVKNEKIRYELFEYLKEKNIYCQVHYLPVYWHPYYQKLGYKKRLNSNAENFYKRELSLPLYPDMNSKQIEYVINCVLKGIEK